MSVGVLALQGDFAMHGEALRLLGLGTREIRKPSDLDEISGIVLPGGESTAMLHLLESEELRRPLVAALREVPVLATCAGLVLLARTVRRPAQASLGLLDVEVERNGYGRQVASGLYDVSGTNGFPDMVGAFIRAPRIVRVGPDVEVLARRAGDPVLVRQGALLAASFHPEVRMPNPVHELFAAMLERRAGRTDRIPS
ncbi:MAG: pyridoxal 5'-phosphate synthase glutaminase subunit PdxT [Planctomycetota bacterium]|jgi:5'-phosphate synthase pdxT subunit